MTTPKPRPSKTPNKTGRPKGKPKTKGKPKGRPAGVSEEKNSNEKNRSDFGIPQAFYDECGISHNIRSQADKLMETIGWNNEDIRQFSDEFLRTEMAPGELRPAGQSWHEMLERSLPLKLLMIEVACQLGFMMSLQPKVEITYDASGNVKSKKISSGSPSVQNASAWMAILDLEMKSAKEMKSKEDSRVVIDVPEGGDRKNHMLAEMIRQHKEKLDGQKPGNNGGPADE